MKKNISYACAINAGNNTSANTVSATTNMVSDTAMKSNNDIIDISTATTDTADSSELAVFVMNPDVENELMALREIYTNDFEDLPSKWGCPCFRVNAMPTSSRFDSKFVSAKLQFTLTKDYPKIPPHVLVESSENLSSTALEEFKTKIAEKTTEVGKDLKGSVMCYEIVAAAGDLLEKYNQRPKILYDLMLSRESKEKIERERLRDGIKNNSDNNNANYPESPYAQSGLTGFDSEGGGATPANNTLNTSGTVNGQFSFLDRVQRDINASLLLEKQKKGSLIAASTSPRSDDENESLISDDGELSDNDELDLFDSNSRNNPSRYRDEFQELKLLGQGGMGTVWKARNRLDRQIYAVKKVKMEMDEKLNAKIKREVTTISQLLHKHVVRYYAAWMETFSASPKRSKDSLDSFEEPSEFLDKSVASSSSSSSSASLSSSSSSNSESNSNSDSDSDSNSDSDSDSDSNSDSDSDSDSENSDSDSSSTSSSSLSGNSPFDQDESIDPSRTISTTQKSSKSRSRVKKEKTSSKNSKLEVDISCGTMVTPNPRLLYIQMEYCPHTLKGIIEKKELWKEQSLIFSWFREIVEGLSYIHGKGLIHRDLKPANIFIDSKNHIKIGDFGLATPENKTKKNSEIPLEKGIDNSIVAIMPDSSGSNMLFGSANTEDSNLTGGVGTALYRAPEQESVFTSNNVEISSLYDSKADMYSLGIILFEMSHQCFSTGMERVMTIKQLRSVNCEIPESMASYSDSKLINLIKWLVNHDPTKRPTAKDVLSSEFLPPRINIDIDYIADIEKTLEQSDSQMSSLIISSLFKRSNSRVNASSIFSKYNSQDILYDIGIQKKIDSDLQPISVLDHNDSLTHRNIETIPLVIRAWVQKSIRHVFEKRGAANFDPALIGLRDTKRYLHSHLSFSSSSGRNEDDSAAIIGGSDEFLDRGGAVVCLSDDLITSFARSSIILDISSAQYYGIGSVYISKSDGGTDSSSDPSNVQHEDSSGSSAMHCHPIPFNEAIYAALDLSQERSEIDIVCTAIELSTQIGPFLPHFSLRLNDIRILDSIIDICCQSSASSISNSDKKKIMKVFSSAYHQSFETSFESLKSLKCASASESFLVSISLFLRALSQNVSDNYDPLRILDKLESAFFTLDKKSKVKESGNSSTIVEAIDDSKRIKIRKNFFEGIEHLKRLINNIFEIYSINDISSNANSRTSTGGTWSRDNSDSSVNSGGNQSRRRSSSLGLDKDFENNSDNANKNWSIVPIHLLVDVGLDYSELGDKRRGNIYHSSKLYFVIECYSLSDISSSSFGVGGPKLTSQTTLSTASFRGSNCSVINSNLMLKRRYKGYQGIILDGGSFTRLLDIYRRILNISSKNSQKQAQAVALRVYIDNVINLILELENKTILSFRNKQSAAVVRSKLNISKMLNDQVPQVMVRVVNNDASPVGSRSENSTSVTNDYLEESLLKVQSSPSFSQLSNARCMGVVHNIIRNTNLKASNSWNQLVLGKNGKKSSSIDDLSIKQMKELCRKRNIPILILVPSNDKDLKYKICFLSRDGKTDIEKVCDFSSITSLLIDHFKISSDIEINIGGSSNGINGTNGGSNISGSSGGISSGSGKTGGAAVGSIQPVQVVQSKTSDEILTVQVVSIDKQGKVFNYKDQKKSGNEPKKHDQLTASYESKLKDFLFIRKDNKLLFRDCSSFERDDSSVKMVSVELPLSVTRQLLSIYLKVLNSNEIVKEISALFDSNSNPHFHKRAVNLHKCLYSYSLTLKQEFNKSTSNNQSKMSNYIYIYSVTDDEIDVLNIKYIEAIN